MNEADGDLEDGIRRLAEARAAEVDDVAWRDRLGGGRRPWTLVAAAAAAVVLVVGVVVALTGDDDPADTEVAGGEDGSTLARWVPADGEVGHIHYGASTLGRFLVNRYGARHDVALVTTPADAAAPDDEDWTTIEVKIPGLTGDDRELGPVTAGGVTLMTLLLDGPEEVTIRSARFDAATLRGAGPALEAAGDDVERLAVVIADLAGDVEVVYTGPAARLDVVVEDEVFGHIVAHVDRDGPEQFFATFPGLEGDPEALADYFAVESIDGAVFDPRYFACCGEPRPVTEAEWDALVDDLLGDEPATTLEAAATDTNAGTPFADLGLTGRATVVDDRATLVLDEPFEWRDGGILTATFGDADQGIRLVFGPLDPGVPATTVPLRARLTAYEAERFTELINDAWDEPAPTVDPYPTIRPGPPPTCDADAPPADATPVDAPGPVDIDGDGLADHLVRSTDDDGVTWLVLAFGDGGFSSPLQVGVGILPAGWGSLGVAPTPDGEVAAYDLTGNGALELFVTGFGTTARQAAVVGLDGCTLRAFAGATDLQPVALSGSFSVLVGTGGNSCGPIGCFPRVTCANGTLVTEITNPNLAGDPEELDVALSAVRVVWTTVEYRWDAEAGRFLETGRSETEYPADDVPPDAPGWPSDVVDCRPESETAPPPSLVCAAEPPAGVLDDAVHLDFDRTPLDLDLDGIDDELFAYEDGDGDAWIIARLAGGWTTPAFLGPVAPTLVYTPDGVPAGADLDDDGGLEFFVGGFGNTARTVAVISTVDCDLARVRYDDDVDEPASVGLVLVGVGGGSCAPTGCLPRVSCPAGGGLRVELTEPAGDGEVVWSSTSFALVDGVLVEVASEDSRFPADARPPDAPDVGDGDVVACVPPVP